MTLTIEPKFKPTIPDDPTQTAAGWVNTTRYNKGSEMKMASGVIIGRKTAGAGLVEELTPDQVRDMLGGAFKLGTVTTLANDAAAIFTLAAGKRQWIFELRGIIPVTSGANLLMLASVDNGANFNVPISGGTGVINTTAIANTAASSVTTGAVIGPAVGGSTNMYGLNGRLVIQQIAGQRPSWLLVGVFRNTSALNRILAGGEIETTSTLTNIQLKFSSGNMASGDITPMTLEA